MNQTTLIQTDEQYQKVKDYTETYILGLMTQKQILRRDSLRIIHQDIRTHGYIPEGWKTRFFLRLFMYEPKHQDTDIDEWVKDLRRFVYQKENPPVPTLESFFTWTQHKEQHMIKETTHKSGKAITKYDGIRINKTELNQVISDLISTHKQNQRIKIEVKTLWSHSVVSMTNQETIRNTTIPVGVSSWFIHPNHSQTNQNRR